MATHTQKVEAEELLREWLAAHGLPAPDDVEYGETCVRFLFHDTRTCLVLDVDEIGAAGAGDTNGRGGP